MRKEAKREADITWKRLTNLLRKTNQALTQTRNLYDYGEQAYGALSAAVGVHDEVRRIAITYMPIRPIKRKRV